MLGVRRQERSVSGAAVRLGLTQSAMSHALNRLRRHLGDELLGRGGAKRAMQPVAWDRTPAGGDVAG
jgi:DNA-binding transcriptional LysR family regulator